MYFCKALISSLEVKFLSFQNVCMKLCGIPYSLVKYAAKTKDYSIFNEK